MKMGGPEINETKLDMRKYVRGHRVKGVWIIEIKEKSPEKNVCGRG